MAEKKITLFQKTIFSEAITPGTATNEYVVKLRQPRDHAEIKEGRILEGAFQGNIKPHQFRLVIKEASP